MNNRIMQIITFTILLCGCGKSVSSREMVPFTGNTEVTECSVLSDAPHLDIDKCLKKACQEVDGVVTDSGCVCKEDKVFVFSSGPNCLNFQKEISVGRRVQEEHELVNYYAFNENSLYSTDVYNYDLSNEVEDIQFSNFMAPNFLSIHLLSDSQEIGKRFVERALQIPYVHVFQTFGDISPIHQVRFHKEMELSTDSPFYELITKIQDSPFISSKDYFFTEKGCLDYCKKEMLFESVGHKITRTKEYFRGILSGDYITIKKEQQKLALFKFDLIGRFFIERIDNEISSQEIEYVMKSFSMNSTGKFTRSLITNQEPISKKKNFNWGNVVLCDNGLTAQKASIYKEVELVKGPNSNSYYGWLNTVTDQSDYYNGAININELGSGETASQDHASSVYGFMKDVSVASISLNSCLHDFDNWASNAFEENFRVVNYSYFDSLDKNSCFSNHKWIDINKNSLAKNFLWVFAAGNDKAYLTPETSMHCPQNIVVNTSNALIVGSDPQYQGVTNKGEEYVDLFVNAPSTSTAAAVVSSLAANIIKRYPQMNSEIVRKSILASVKYQGMSSRTGGLLDESKAYLAAEMLEKNPSINNKKLLNELHCGWFNCIDKNWFRRFNK